MAGDTRDTSKTYETFGSAPPSANALPAGSGQNTAGSVSNTNPESLNITNAVKTVRLQDFKQVHMYPCVRESFLMGIGGAFGVGSLRAVLGGAFFLLLG